MEYNTQREPLKITDYGRNVMKMIDYAKTIADRAERTQMAYLIVETMALVNPKVKERTEYRHILWDHLMLMSDYELDVDTPYPVVREVTEAFHPKPIDYSDSKIRYRHYGHLTEAFMQKAKEMPAGAEREALTAMMANYMKRSLYNWNRDAMDERKVYADLENYMDGEAQLPENFHFASVSSGHLPDYTGSNGGKKKKKK